MMKTQQEQKKEIGKAYGKYTKQFSPKPRYFRNCLRAFWTGGLLCVMGSLGQNYLMDGGMTKENAGIVVTISLVALAQLLTGFGFFDSIAKFAGAGVIVPITGFANSMVAPAIEYKHEGIVLGVGAKLFSLAGPVLVCGISTATIAGIIYYIIQGM